MILLQMGRFDDAIAALVAGVDSSRGPVRGTLVLANAAAGRIAASKRLLEELIDSARREYIPLVSFVYAWLGMEDQERALDALNDVVKTSSAGLMGLLLDPRVDPLRDSERFQQFLRRMNLA